MHVYIRWYEQGKPKSQPLRMANEYEAKAAILAKFSTATFGNRTKSVNQPNGAMLSGIDEMLFAWPGPSQPGVEPIADILFPAK